MPYALTVKSQVTVPKAVREHLKVLPGQRIDYEPLPDGSVRMVAAEPTQPQLDMRSALAKWRGAGIAGMSTEEILNETRGEGWNRP